MSAVLQRLKPTVAAIKMDWFPWLAVMPSHQRLQLYRHLAGQLRNGIALGQSLQMFARRGDPDGKKTDSSIHQVIRRLQDGKALGTAFQGILPEEETLLLECGEVGGDLPGILELLVHSREQQTAVIRTLRETATAPLVYLAAMLAMLWVIGAWVLPSLQTVLPPSKAHGLVAMLYTLGAWAQQGWVLFLLVVLSLVAFVALVRSFSRWQGTSRLRAEQFFPYSLYRDLKGYVWLTGFSTLLLSGMHEVQILRQQKERASPWLKERLSHLMLQLENGKSLGAALQARGPGAYLRFNFPNPEVVEEILSIDGHRDFAKRLGETRNRWSQALEYEMQTRSKRFGFWLEMGLFGGMGLLMMAINDLSMQVGNIRY